MSGAEEVITAMALALAKTAIAEGMRSNELDSQDSSALVASSVQHLDQPSTVLFNMKARAKSLEALLKDLSGRDLHNSRLLMYTEDDGKAWLLAQLAEKLARDSADLKALRSFFSVTGDVMLHKSTQWASDELLATGLWSVDGPLHESDKLPTCDFSFQWGPTLGGTGHSYSDKVLAVTSSFTIEFNRAAVNVDTHATIPRLAEDTHSMLASLEACRAGESWAFGDGESLSSETSVGAARNLLEFVDMMQINTHFVVPDVARELIRGILEGDASARAEGIGAAYMLVVALRGLVACSVGNRMVGIRFLSSLTEVSSIQARAADALMMLSSVSVTSTVEEVRAMTPAGVREAIGPQEFERAFGKGYGVGVKGRWQGYGCVLDLSSRQSSHPAEAILELGGSVLPDLSKRYNDRESLRFGETIVGPLKDRTRVAFVRDEVSTTLSKHYEMVDVGGFEVSSLSMMLGSLNLTYLTSEPRGVFQTWIYSTLWGKLCGRVHDAESITHAALYEHAARKVSLWNKKADMADGPVTSSAALYLATVIIGKKAGEYDGDFGSWCEAIGFKRSAGTESGIVADERFHVQTCRVWDTEAGKAVRLGGKLLNLVMTDEIRRGEYDKCELTVGEAFSLDEVPPTEESLRLC